MELLSPKSVEPYKRKTVLVNSRLATLKIILTSMSAGHKTRTKLNNKAVLRDSVKAKWNRKTNIL